MWLSTDWSFSSFGITIFLSFFVAGRAEKPLDARPVAEGSSECNCTNGHVTFATREGTVELSRREGAASIGVARAKRGNSR